MAFQGFWKVRGNHWFCRIFFWASHRVEEKGYDEAIGMTASLIILSGVCLLGLVVTYLLTRETMGRSLEDNENDD